MGSKRNLQYVVCSLSAGLVHLCTKSFSDLLNLNHNAATLPLLFTFVRGKYNKTDSKCSQIGCYC